MIHQMCQSKRPRRAGGMTNSYPMKFKKEKCEVLLFGWNNTLTWYRMETDCLGSSSPELDLCVSVDSKVSMSQRHDLVAKRDTSIMGCINRSTASGLKEQLTSAAQHLLGCVWNTGHFWTPQFKKDD